MKNNNSAIIITLAAALCSCVEKQVIHDDASCAALEIEVTADMTKAVVEGGYLPAGASIGLTLTDASGTAYGEETVSNVRYTATGEGASQSWDPERDVMLNSSVGTVCAYYPYSQSVTDIKAVPVASGNDDDYMWATPVRGVNMQNNTVSITMNHALAGIRMSVVKGSYTGTGLMTNMSISSEAVATSAMLDATDGSLSQFQNKGETVSATVSATLSASAYNKDFLLIPTGESAAVTMSVVVDGVTYQTQTPAMTLQAGTMLNYTLRMNGTELEITSVAVTPWATNDQGHSDLEPFKDAVPDPYVEWARIQHVDGTLYTADQWLAAEAAGTVTDADANGIAVRYSQYAVCPHVIHPKYSTSKMMWSLNTSVTVPGVYTTTSSSTSDPYSCNYDVNGKANTEAILAAVTAGIIPDAPAAQYCDGVTFAKGQKGYLPAAGEVCAWANNKTAINACMDAIGGDSVGVSSFMNTWTSTQYSGFNAWRWNYDSDNVIITNYKVSNYSVRAVSDYSYFPANEY